MDLSKIIDSAVQDTVKALQRPEVVKSTYGLAAAQYGYSLEAPAKQLVPFLPSWATSIPRGNVATGNIHEYRRILSIGTTGKSTASEGTVGNAAAIVQDKKTVSLGILSSGLFDVTWEAERAAGTYDDVRARAVTQALLNAKRLECAHILGGNVTALAAPASVVAADGAASGDVAAVAHFIYIKALTAMAVQKMILSGYGLLPDSTTFGAAGLNALVDQTDGFGPESTVATITPTVNKSVLLTWAPVQGAVGYAIFMGTTTGVANCKCQGMVGQSKVAISHLATAGSVCVTGDNSADADDFVGLIGLMTAPGSGAYVKYLNAALTAAVGNGIPEIDTMLAQCYGQALGIDDGTLIVGTQDRANISRKLGAGSSTTISRLMIPVSGENEFAGGLFANRYVHPITGRLIPIETDPYLYSGTIIWLPKTIPYPMAEVPAPVKLWNSYDWTAFEYAVTAPVRRYENRLRGGLALYLPPATGIITNIWNG
jgi:hypothetical protein